jgi:hexulose-6-phosphate isomerase
MWAKNDGLDSERIADAKAWLTDKYQQTFRPPHYEGIVNSGVKYVG